MAVGQICFNAPLSHHCSWKIGGPADLLVQPSDIQQLSRVILYAVQNKLPYIVIGDGSNVLFADEGFRGIVIRIGRAMSSVRIEEDQVYAQAGIAVPTLARTVAVAGLSGLEHTVGIPGTLGGLVAMNGGSLRQTIGQVIESVCFVDEAGRITELDAGDCEFSYRHSIFLGKPWVVSDVVMRLKRSERDGICTKMLEILRERRCRFPRRQPNCGSVFKSDDALHQKCGPPGWIIEQAGLKGRRLGGAQVSSQHANFIINTGTATAADVLELIRTIRNRVHEKMGVWLECEVRYVQLDGQIIPAHLET